MNKVHIRMKNKRKLTSSVQNYSLEFLAHPYLYSLPITREYYDGFIILSTGENMVGENMAEWLKTRHIFPVAILPVSKLSASKFQNFVSDVNVPI